MTQQLLFAPREDKERSFAEALRQEGPLKEKPIRVSQCPYCKLAYLSISYHLLYICGSNWDSGLETEKTPESRPVEPEAPTQKESPGGLEIQQEEKPKRDPHWWHWVKPSSTGSKAQETFTPSPMSRRRSIPSIACALYSQSWSLYHTKQSADNASPGYVKINQRFYEVDTNKVEKFIDLLVFCGVEEKLARGLAREAWQDAKEGTFRQWGKGAGRKLLRLIGYELADGEPDGSFDSAGVSFADFAQEEGAKGR